jgi:uncharacterized membrane protein
MLFLAVILFFLPRSIAGIIYLYASPRLTVILNVLADGKVPVDETTKERKILTYSILQLVVIAALAGFGLLYSIFLLYFNISKRNHK